jgi:surface antigen
MRLKLLSLLALTAFTVSACNQTTGNKELLGGIGGAAVGGLAGAQFGKGKGQLVGVGLGALLGTLAGSSIGQSLDRADMMYAQQASQRAQTAPLGSAITWNNPESGNSGTITPVRDGRSSNGRYCREYSQSIVVDGRKETGYGTACQNPDGTWQVVN